MNRDVQIKISSIRKEYIDGIVEKGVEQDEPIEIITSATYFYKDQLHYIFYEEKQEESPVITKNKIIIKENESVELIKKGAVSSNMMFEKGKSQQSIYRTDFFQMDMMLETKSLEMDLTEDLLNIQLEYHMEVNQKPYALCEMKMEVKEGQGN